MTKVLIIDDAALMRVYLRRCLEKAGFEVEDWMPLSAMEIPDRIATSQPDVILTDYQMAGCNGATVAKMAQKANPEIPVLVLTAFHNAEMEANLGRFNVRRILDKPISAEDLARELKDVIKDKTS